DLVSFATRRPVLARIRSFFIGKHRVVDTLHSTPNVSFWSDAIKKERILARTGLLVANDPLFVRRNAIVSWPGVPLGLIRKNNFTLRFVCELHGSFPATLSRGAVAIVRDVVWTNPALNNREPPARGFERV